ncbi:MAG: ankyrin repeat domain-containing protein, partial [Cyanobacteria bacterium]|nr:ankyrin repeat domain-containing protein [Cyanobacteriota bacterium]
LGRGEMVDLLLKYGARLETLNHLEQTPLHLAAGHGEIKSLQSLLNAGASPHVQDKLGRTPLHDACLSSHSESVEILINNNADPSIKDKRGTTPLHDAAESGDYKTLYPVLKAARVKRLPVYDLKDQNGNTPFHHYLISSGDTRGGKLFLRMGADPRIKTNDGLNALHLALLHHHSDLIDSLLIKGAKLSPPLRMDELAKKIRIVSKMDMSPSHTQVPLMLRAMPSLLLELPLVVTNEFAERFELFFDKPEDVHGYHPLEAEMMLLLNHPDLQDRDPQKTSSLAQALTSISYFIGDYIPLNDPVLKSWKDIGLLTHSFRFWRFDAMGGESSLFNAFGFKPMPDPRPGEIFGKGFVYQDPDSKIVFEFRRGYLLASHPQHGTLVIRNSSPVFGRKLLNHPAYLLPNSFDKESLKTFDPSKIDEKLYVLNKDLYRNPETSTHLSALTEGLMHLKDEYKRFKLDTEAFEGYGATRHFTGHLVPGLPAMMKQIKSFQSLKPNTLLPDLGFVDSRFPIYQPYGYQDNQNQLQRRYPLTSKNLQELEDFTQGHWTPKKYPDSNWIRFLHQAGVENRAELVMLEVDTPET